MAFTAAELTSIANSALDFYMNKGTAFKQSIQAKPMLEFQTRNAKTFPGGKANISVGIKGVFGAAGVNDTVKGYTHNDAVTFYTPTNIQRANYPWREHHIGITVTHTELKIDGISVTDENGSGTSTSEHSQREMTVLVNLLQDKFEDFGEQYARSMNSLMWGDGTADAKALAGIRSLITTAPATGVIGGIDRASYAWWRNRALLSIASSPTNGGVLVQALQNEHRQLIRFGGNPTRMHAGSAFINAMEIEMRANGNYTMTGFKPTQDASMGGMQFMGRDVIYDPTLDDLNLSKFMYWWDPRHIFLSKMEGEWDHQFTPSRPYNQFLIYKSITNTGQFVAKQLNSSGVYSIA